ncbi:MAG: DUF2117 domain-containing protein [Euryarchaeota archaeon]|nr:DUF2117 domain-containing protein [Euryarchaeota archaeon]
MRRSGEKGVYLIDHSAEDSVYRCRETWLVVAVGDDTSRIAGNLLYRFGVPIVAIRDGDEDGICAESQLAEGSIALRFRKNTDDIVGQRTREVIFGGGDFIDQRVSPGAMARRIRDIASDLLL